MNTEYSVTVDIVASSEVSLDALAGPLNDVGVSVLHADQLDNRRVGGTFTVEASALEQAVAAGVARFKSIVPGEVVHASARTYEELDRELAQPATVLVGPQEMAVNLGISRQRLYEVMKMEGFPEPMVQLGIGPIWDTESVNHFVQTWKRKPGRPRKIVTVGEQGLVLTETLADESTTLAAAAALERASLQLKNAVSGKHLPPGIRPLSEATKKRIRAGFDRLQAEG